MTLDVSHYFVKTNSLESAGEPSPLLLDRSPTISSNQEDVQITVIKLDQSLFIHCCLKEDQKLENLVLTLPSRFQQTPLSTDIFGGQASSDQTELSQALASRLTQKYKQPVYLSYNLQTRDLGIEKELFSIVKNKMC